MTDSHYDTVGQALLTMVAELLGRDFNPEVQEAWTGLYQAVEMLMKRGAAAAAPLC